MEQSQLHRVIILFIYISIAFKLVRTFAKPFQFMVDISVFWWTTSWFGFNKLRPGPLLLTQIEFNPSINK